MIRISLYTYGLLWRYKVLWNKELGQIGKTPHEIINQKVRFNVRILSISGWLSIGMMVKRLSIGEIVYKTNKGKSLEK